MANFFEQFVSPQPAPIAPELAADGNPLAFKTESDLRRGARFTPAEQAESLARETSPAARDELLAAIGGERDPAKRAILVDSYQRDFGEAPPSGVMPTGGKSSAAPAQQNFFAQFVGKTPAAPEQSFSPEAMRARRGPNSGLGRRTADFAGVDASRGVVSFGESLVGIADILTFGAAGKGLAAIGYDPKRTHAFLADFYSGERKAANEKVENASGFVDTALSMIQNPSTIAGSVIQSLPGTVGIGAVGYRMADKAYRLAYEGAKHLGADAAKKAGQEAITALMPRLLTGTSAAEGAQAAGSIAEQARQEGREWADYVLPALGGGAGTALIARGSGALADKIGAGNVETAIATAGMGRPAGATGNIAARTAKGAVTEGGEELLQSGQEQAFSNIAQDRPLGEGVSEAAAAGMLTGAAMGGGSAALTRRGVPARTTEDAAILDAVAQSDQSPAPTNVESAAAPRQPTGPTQSSVQPDAGVIPPGDIAQAMTGQPEEMPGATGAPGQGDAMQQFAEGFGDIPATAQYVREGVSYTPNTPPTEADQTAAHLAATERQFRDNQIAQDVSQSAVPYERVTPPVASAPAPATEPAAQPAAFPDRLELIPIEQGASGGDQQYDFSRIKSFNSPQSAALAAARALQETGQRHDIVAHPTQPDALAVVPSGSGMAAAVVRVAAPSVARQDAARMGSIEDLAVDDNGSLALPENEPMMRAFLQSLPAAEAAAMVDAQGRVTQIGMRRFQNAVLARAYGGNPVVQKLLSGKTAFAQRLSASLTKMAPMVSAIKDAVQQRAVADRDITDTIVGAVDELVRMRAEGRKPGQALAQSGLFQDVTPETAALVEFIEENLNAPDRLNAFLQAYLEELQRYGSDQQGQLFSGPVVPQGADLIDAARSRMDGQPQFQKPPAKEPGNGEGGEVSQVEGAPGEGGLQERAGEAAGNADAAATSTGTADAAEVSSAAQTGEQRGDGPVDGADAGRSAGEGESDAVAAQDAPAAASDQVEKAEVPAETQEQDAAAKIAEASLDAAHSPENDKPLPSRAQIEAGNYPLGHLRLFGLDISIENPKGSTRTGIDPDGQPWQVKIQAAYGYIKRTLARDGDHVDVYLTGNPTEQTPVFVVDQIDPKTGRFDEHKVVLGATTQAEAETLYDAHFSDKSGPQRRGAIRQWTLERFKTWIKTGNTRRPVTYKEPKAEAKPASSETKPDRSETPAPQGDVYRRLEDIANRLGVKVFKAGGGWHATGDMVEIPDADVDVAAQGGVSASHVFAHELGHTVLTKRGISFASFPKREIEKYIENWSDLVQASKDFRPGVHDHENQRIRAHAKKPNEIIADAIASVLIGDRPATMLAPMMKALGLNERDLGMPNKQTETPAAPSETPARIDDVGEKIGGARKDLWRDRGLSVDDLSGMSGGEQSQFATKDNVWPKIDYAKRITDGMEPKAAALLKQIRDGIAAKPRKDDVDGRRRYVETLGMLRDMAADARTVDDVKALSNQLTSALGIQAGTTSLEGRAALERLWSIYRGRTNPIRIGWDDERRADRLLKEGWPTPVRGARESKGKDAGETPDRPYLDELQRTGEDLRGGRNATGEEVKDAFGFRGIEYGNYAAQDERQRLLNLAFDGLHDLASLLGVPPKAISFNGTLGIAFGARGGGNFAAHYEPGKLVINMTKLRGGGSLAHEWAHALDHYFGELDRPDAYQGRARGATGWYTRGYAKHENLRPEMAAAFDRVMAAIHYKPGTRSQSSYVTQAGKLSGKSGSSGYWARPTELFARAFESYVFDKIAADDRVSQYLVQGVEADRFEADRYKGNPYPTGDERKAINEAFDALVAAVQTRETDRGVAMFSRDGNAFAANALAEFAETDEFFRYPVSKSTDLDSVMAEIIPDVEVLGNATRPEESRDSGADRRFMFRTGNNQDFYVYERGRDVWVDISRLTSGSQGSAVYAAVLNYAHNARKRLIGDPAGLSADAVVRRTNAMLSSALRFGTTRHMDAAQEQRAGDPDKGIVPLRWGGTDVENVRSLIDSSLGTLYADAPELKGMRYDFSRQRFVRADGSVVNRQWFVDTGKETRLRGHRGGEASLRRGVLLQSLVSSEAGQRPGILQSVLSRSVSLAREGGLDGVFSRAQAPERGLSASGGDSVARVTAELAERLGRAPDPSAVSIIPSWRDLPEDRRLFVESRRAFDVQGMFDPDTGRVYLIADNLRRGTAFSVFLHELGVHKGMRDFIGVESFTGLVKQVRTWADLSMGEEGQIARAALARIPADTEASVRDEEAVAYFVEEAVRRGHDIPQSRPEKRGLGQWLYDLWQAVRGALAKLRAEPSTLTAADVVALARGAAERAMSGGNLKYTGGAGVPVMSVARAPWIDQQSAETQEALRKAGIWHQPPTLKQRVSEWSQDWQKRVRQGFVDQFDPIKEIDPRAYMLARLTKSADAALEGLLMNGEIFLDQDGAVDVRYEKGGFLGILSKLNGEHDRFLAWVVGNRAGRLMQEGREHNFTPEDIRRLKALNQGQMPDGRSRANEYQKTLADLNRYNKVVVDMAEKAGLVDGQSRQAWERDFYIPFYRLMEEHDQSKGPMPSKGLVNQYAFKTLKGGQQALGDPLQNMLRNWSHLVDASLRNQAAKASIEAAIPLGGVIEGTEEVVRQMAKSAGRSDAVMSILDQGVQRWFAVEDPFLVDALKSIGFSGFQGPAMKVLQKAKHLLTLGVTISPTFRIRNLIRDSLSMIGANPASYNVASNVLTGWKGTKEGTPDFAHILSGGGVMRYGSWLEGDRAEHVKRLIDAGVDDKTILTTPQKVRAAMQSAWDWWQKTGDRAENVNRVALYKKLRAEGKSHLEASYAARDVMDFSMQGTWGAVRFLAQTVPFFNARLQGMYKLGRGALEDPRRFSVVTGAVAMASIALLLAYEDDEDWKQREDWDREVFWWFKIGDTAYRIPKPFEIGALATIAERGMEAMISDELTGKEFAQRVRSIVMEQMSMNPTPQFIKPMIELWANKNFFTGRDIESMGMERLSTSERYGAYTSGVARAVGQTDIISPVKFDHLVRAYFGWLGTHIVMAADFAVQPLMGMPDRPERRIDDYFVVGDFAKELPAYQSRYITRLYDQAKKSQEAMADIRHYRQLGELERAKEIAEERREDIALYGIYTRAQRRLSEINKQIRNTQMSDAISAEEKRERLTMLGDQKNRVARLTEMRARERRTLSQQSE